MNRREDGYHNIQSIFVELDLHDELEFTSKAKYKLTSNGLAVPVDGSNLISKAYHLLRSRVESVDTEYAIHLKKQIPIGSGLGGGSSNAGATLKALNQLWQLNLTTEELERLAAKLGADVPFFINGGIQLIEGIGDLLIPIESTPLEGIAILLVVPPINISTTWAYDALNKTLQPCKRLPKFRPLSKPMKWELFENDFERVIRKTYPEIGKIKENLQKVDALYAGLSGSGSTVFGVFDNHQKAESILGKFSQFQTFLSSPVFR